MRFIHASLGCKGVHCTSAMHAFSVVPRATFLTVNPNLLKRRVPIFSFQIEHNDFRLHSPRLLDAQCQGEGLHLQASVWWLDRANGHARQATLLFLTRSGRGFSHNCMTLRAWESIGACHLEFSICKLTVKDLFEMFLPGNKVFFYRYDEIALSVKDGRRSCMLCLMRNCM
jgi:hypothetical protein